MKTVILLCALLFAFYFAYSQQPADKRSRFDIGAQYNHEFVLDGYVRVREWELYGDKVKLRDLGVDNYSVIQVLMEKYLRNNASLALTYDQYFIHGSATFDRDIAYNGTLINGRRGIDVSPTRYYRLSINYRGILLDRTHWNLKYLVGVVFDHITFYLDGEVSTASMRSEVYEGFGRQAFPYPVIGLKGSTELGQTGRLNVEVSGTYIPEFKSFYTESSRVYLQYSTFLADLSYSRLIADIELKLGIKLRQMHLFQESNEDTNIISTLTTGPYLSAIYHFGRKVDGKD